jgi:hypothetical protein
MPAERLAKHFDPLLGRPTKELYSMAGLIFVMEFRNWTHEEAADAYMYNVDLQYALNLAPEGQSMCRRTIERYIKLFREDDLAQQIMLDVTSQLVEELESDVSKQRLDSTHIESNMAKFGRIKLMATVIRRFLTQVKRHDEGSYKRLPGHIRDRYEASPNSVFGWKKLEDDAVDELRQSVAEDLCYLVDRYRRNKKHNGRSTYTMLVTVFEQQCEVVDDKVAVKKNTGGNIVVNPSDPDATFDGHKGAGYQVQLAETCSDQNEVQLIMAAIPETAVESDSKALPKLLDHYQEHGHQPDTLYGDTAYGSDSNSEACHRGRNLENVEDRLKQARGDRDEPVIRLVSPPPGTKSSDQEQDATEDATEPPLTILDFEFSREENRFTKCPAGHELHRAHNSDDCHHIMMLSTVCRTCRSVARCPLRKDSMLHDLRISGKDLRLAQRRAKQNTKEFRDEYRIRSGIEATNSCLKQVTGLGRLRVRGRPAVFTSILLKVAGWNILQAARVRSLIEKLGQTAGSANSGQSCARFRGLKTLRDTVQRLRATRATPFDKTEAIAA